MAEGVAETVLRVGLALLERNQRRIIRCNDFESLARILTRGLWMEGRPIEETMQDEEAMRREVSEIIVEAMAWGKVVTPETLDTLSEEWEREQMAKASPSPAGINTKVAATVTGRA
jgi:hypothetical protein